MPRFWQRLRSDELRKHRQSLKLPFLPILVQIFRHFEPEQVPQCPSDDHALSFKIILMFFRCSENLAQISGNARLFSQNQLFHLLSLLAGSPAQMLSASILPKTTLPGLIHASSSIIVPGKTTELLSITTLFPILIGSSLHQ